MTRTPKVATSWPMMINFGLLAAFWGMLFWQLSYEWSRNEQYSYGLFVPFLGVYLLHLRWEDRPVPRPPAGRLSTLLPGLAIGLAVLALYPIKIIFEANADWRLNLWAQALMTFGLSLLLLHHWGGPRWMRHFGFPFFFYLTAVPWPRWLEDQLVIQLMGFVATATVETANLLGVYAVQSGNIITLRNGIVSVEEACSGVRSFQSTIMGAIFLSELFRFTPLWRVLLVVLGACFAIFFNFCRTLTLTLISAEHGSETMERWHDSAGYLVFFLSMAALGLLCLLIRWKLLPKKRREGHTGGPFMQEPGWLPRHLGLAAIGLVLLSQPATELWYRLRGPESSQGLRWAVDWYAGTHELKFEEIEPRIQDILFYSEGELVTWKTPNNYKWIAYYFEWGTGRSAQLGGVHNPELCLPAVGWNMDDQAPDLLWHGPQGLELIFNSYFFTNPQSEAYVFYCQWDPQGYPYHTKEGRFRLDRIHDAWIGDRKAGKQQLEIIIYGPRSMADAKAALVKFLNEAIHLQSSGH